MELLFENINKEDLKKYIKEYYNYAKKKLKINKTPKVVLEYSKKNAEDFLGKTGFYNPDAGSIHLFLVDRHPKDVLRSFAHELIHHEQNCTGKNKGLNLKKTSTDPAYSLHDKGLREMEREAFEKGSMMFRDWCDMKKIKRTNVMENKQTNIPYKDLFEKKDRALDGVKTNHENELFEELKKRYIQKEVKEEK